jgi:hypothetical protein
VAVKALNLVCWKLKTHVCENTYVHVDIHPRIYLHGHQWKWEWIFLFKQCCFKMANVAVPTSCVWECPFELIICPHLPKFKNTSILWFKFYFWDSLLLKDKKGVCVERGTVNSSKILETSWISTIKGHGRINDDIFIL